MLFGLRAQDLSRPSVLVLAWLALGRHWCLDVSGVQGFSYKSDVSTESHIKTNIKSTLLSGCGRRSPAGRQYVWWSRNKDLSSVTLATTWTTKASPMQRGAHLLRSFIHLSNAFCLFLGALPPPSPASPPHRCSRRRTKSTKNPQGFSLKFGIRCFSCNVAFASGVSHGAWRSPSVLVYTFF